eukprot:9596697-Alexandrium_andersonii.AAC.1
MAKPAAGEGAPFQFEFAEHALKLLGASYGLRLLAGKLEVAHTLCHEQLQDGLPGGIPSQMLHAEFGVYRAGPEPAHVSGHLGQFEREAPGRSVAARARFLAVQDFCGRVEVFVARQLT